MITSDESSNEADVSDAHTAAILTRAQSPLEEMWGTHGADFRDWLVGAEADGAPDETSVRQPRAERATLAPH